jgi:hypothetical protein
MRLSYTTNGQDMLEGLPTIPILLKSDVANVDTVGLLDSGAMVNVLPFSIGKQLGLIWNDDFATINLSGALKKSNAIPVLLKAEIFDFQEFKIVFAWTSVDETPLILGQMNFFKLFDICFFGSETQFEIRLKK